MILHFLHLYFSSSNFQKFFPLTFVLTLLFKLIFTNNYLHIAYHLIFRPIFLPLLIILWLSFLKFYLRHLIIYNYRCFTSPSIMTKFANKWLQHSWTRWLWHCWSFIDSFYSQPEYNTYSIQYGSLIEWFFCHFYWTKWTFFFVSQ